MKSFILIYALHFTCTVSSFQAWILSVSVSQEIKYIATYLLLLRLWRFRGEQLF